MFEKNEVKSYLQKKVQEDFESAKDRPSKNMIVSLSEKGCGIADLGKGYVPIIKGKILVKTNEDTNVFCVENKKLVNPRKGITMVIKPCKLISTAIFDSEGHESFMRIHCKKDSDVKITDEVFGFIETTYFMYLFSFDPALQKIGIVRIADSPDSRTESFKVLSNSLNKYFINVEPLHSVPDAVMEGDYYNE